MKYLTEKGLSVADFLKDLKEGNSLFVGALFWWGDSIVFASSRASKY